MQTADPLTSRGDQEPEPGTEAEGSALLRPMGLAQITGAVIGGATVGAVLGGLPGVIVGGTIASLVGAGLAAHDRYR